MDKVFLDANVLFSVAYRPDSGLTNLWSLEETELATSRYALQEASRNLADDKPVALAYLGELSSRLTIVEESEASLPEDIGLPEKDAPILSAAMHAACSHLLTGDHRHFGAFFGRSVSGVMILTPAQYFKIRAERT